MAVKYEFVTSKGRPALPELRKAMTKVKKEMKMAQIKLPIQTMALANLAGKYMAERVRRRTRRQGSTGKLADALAASVDFTRISKNQFAITVGDSSSLPVYWAMINYGGHVSPEFVYGFWSDGTGNSKYSKRGGKGTGVFVADGQGTIMTPRRPIKGFHYILYAHVRMLSYVNRSFNIFKK